VGKTNELGAPPKGEGVKKPHKEGFQMRKSSDSLPAGGRKTEKLLSSEKDCYENEPSPSVSNKGGLTTLPFKRKKGSQPRVRREEEVTSCVK